MDSSVWNQLDMSTCGNTEAPKPKPENKYREVDMRRLQEVVVTKLIHPITHGQCHSFIIKQIINTTLGHLSGEDIHHSPNNRTRDPPEKSSQVNW